MAKHAFKQEGKQGPGGPEDTHNPRPLTARGRTAPKPTLGPTGLLLECRERSVADSHFNSLAAEGILFICIFNSWYLFLLDCVLG